MSGWLKEKEKTWNPIDIVRAIVDAPSTQTLTIGEAKFHVFSRKVNVVCAISKGRRIGVVVYATTIGVFVVSFQWPYRLPQVFSYMEDFYYYHNLLQS